MRYFLWKLEFVSKVSSIIVLSSLITHQQTVYVQNRCTSVTGRLISDILETADTLNLNVYLVTIDIEKAFDSLNHSFFMAFLKKLGFGTSFLECSEDVLKNQELCVINATTTTAYFKLQKGTRQVDPISTYLFILALEILFYLIKSNNKIEDLNICDYSFLYSAYVDDTTFILKNVSYKLFQNIRGSLFT